MSTTAAGPQMDESRAVGCLLGLACGDATGAAMEFMPRGRFTPITDMSGGGKFQLERGLWTDDTSMALCLADSLLAVNGFDADDQIERYARWLFTGYNASRPKAFGIGQTVLKAILAFRKTGDAYSGSTASSSSGNGSLMRLAPVPIFYFRDPERAIAFAGLSSRTTHGSAECLQACEYFSHILFRALSGTAKERIFDPPAGQRFEHLSHIVSGDFQRKGSNDVRGTGYVIDCLEAALWAFWHTDNFRAAILAAANLGDDADTTAAISGQLAGAYYGRSGIPEDWLRVLYRAADIENIAIRLADGPRP